LVFASEGIAPTIWCDEKSCDSVPTPKAATTPIGTPGTRSHGTFTRSCEFNPIAIRGSPMSKKAKKRKYSRSAGSDVKSEMHRYKKGTAKSGRGGKGGKVKSRKQAIAIGLSKARKKGKKVPKKKS
jgi:hypothetical protein